MGLESTATSSLPTEKVKILIKGRRTAVYELKISEVASKLPELGFDAQPMTPLQETPIYHMPRGMTRTARTMMPLAYGMLHVSSTMTPPSGQMMQTLPTAMPIITPYDFGGRGIIRPLFDHYIHGTDAVLFVINCADRLRLPDLGNQLFEMALQNDQSDAIVCVIAENYDLPGAISVEELISTFQLRFLRLERSLFPVSSLKVGMVAAMKWLSQELQSRKTKSWVSTLMDNMISSPTPGPAPRITLTPTKFMSANQGENGITRKHPYSLRDRQVKQSIGWNKYETLTHRPQEAHGFTPTTTKNTPSAKESKTMFGDLVSLFKQTMTSR
ncbi:hypothetical protein ScPMuIL_000891 [Solemya velum]